MCVLYRTQLSYAKSVQAVKGMLEVLRDKLPDSCSATMNGLLSAVQASQVLVYHTYSGTLTLWGMVFELSEEFYSVE